MKKKMLSYVCSCTMALSLTGMNTPVLAKAKPKLSRLSVTLYADSAAQKSIKLSVKNGRNVKWLSSNKKVATVKKGKVTAKKKGSAVITAKASRSALKCKVTVKNVTISSRKLNLSVGQTKKVSLIGDSIRSIRSSDKKIATASKSGKVKGIKAGNVKITVTGRNGKNYVSSVKVQKLKAVTSKASPQSGGTQKTAGAAALPEKTADTGNQSDKSQSTTSQNTQSSGTAASDQYTSDNQSGNSQTLNDNANTQPSSSTPDKSSEKDDTDNTKKVSLVLEGDTLTVSGTGEVNEQDIISFGLPKVRSVKNVIIKDGIARIGSGAFMDFNSLESVKIPNSVTSIGGCAFAGLHNLTSIDLPDSITSIESYAFSGADGLKSISIPDSVTTIGEKAFDKCLALENVKLSNSLTRIGWNAFVGCPFKSITLPNSLTEIEEGVFFGCESLKEINIPDSVTSIGTDAFKGCEALESVNIPNSVTSIGDYAFNRCSLKTVTIPNSVTSIGRGAFSCCNDLEYIYYNGSAPDAPWGAIFAKIIRNAE